MTTEPKTMRSELFSPGQIQRVVVKLGSATLTDREKGLRESTMRAVATVVSREWDRGVRFAVVTSGGLCQVKISQAIWR